MSPDAGVSQRPVIDHRIGDADSRVVIEHCREAILQASDDFGGRIVRLAVPQNLRHQITLREGYRERRTESLAASFGDQDSEFVFLELEDVVKIAAHFVSRMAAGRNGEI